MKPSAAEFARGYFVPGIVALYVLSGYYKVLPAVQSLPLDVTLLTGLACVIMMVFSVLHWDSVPRGVSTVATLYLLLLIPLAWTNMAGTYQRQKVIEMWTLTLVAILSPVMLISSRGALRRFIFSFTAVGAVIVLLALVQPSDEIPHASQRVGLEAGSPLLLGRVAGALLIISLLSLVWRALPRVTCVVMLVGASFALMASGSRGPLFGAIAALVIVVVLASSWRNAFKAAALFPVFAFALLASVRYAPIFAVTRIEDLLLGRLDPSSTARLTLGRIAWKTALAHPWGGLGWGGFSTVSPDPVGMAYPHNIVVELLSETGLFIAIAVLVWLGRLWCQSARSAHDFDGSIVFSLLTYSSVQMFVSGVMTDRMFFFFLGMAVALVSLRDGPEAEQPVDLGAADVAAPRARTPSRPIGRPGPRRGDPTS